MFPIRTVLFSIIIIVSATDGIKPPAESLELVHVLFRHGDRTNDASTIYPKDPYRNETYFPVGIGQLTNQGKRKMFGVGKWLRKRYDPYLGDYYTPGLIEARSSDSDRTKASLLLVLAGLFPPLSTQQWNLLLPWQPIPTKYTNKNDDKMFYGIFCAKYQQKFQTYTSSDEYRKRFSKHEVLADYLSENTGWNVTDFSGIAIVYLGLKSEDELGLELPKWTESVYPHPLKELAPKFYEDFSATPEFMKYTAGFMLSKILKDTYAKINEEPSTNGTKMHLLSGHEINSAFMLILLDVFKPHIPPYGAQIIFELHKINGIHGYMIYYQDYSATEPQLLDLPKCGPFCAVDKFQKLYQKYLPDEQTLC